MKYINKAIMLDNNYVDAYINRAKVYFRLGKYNLALNDID